MQSALVVPSHGVPRAKLIASSQRTYLAVAHNDGSISVFKDFVRTCTILNPHQSVCFMRIVRDSLLVGFESGLFAKYCIYTGHLKVFVELDFELRDCLLVESSILLIGDEPQLIVVHRKTLDVERAIALPAVPVHVTKYGTIAIVYCNGQIDRVNEETWELSSAFSLPTKRSEGGVEETIIGATVLPNGQWVIIRRNTWTLYEKENGALVPQFESAAVSPFNYCVPDAEGILVVCDDEKVILIENNNVQVIDPSWPPCTLAGVAFLGVGRCAFSHDLAYFVLENRSGQWAGPSTFTSITGQKWCVSDGYMCQSTTIETILGKKTVFELPAAIAALHVEENLMYAGLVNGSLAIIDTSSPEFKLRNTIYLLNSSIVGIRVCKDWIVTWSRDTVAAANCKDCSRFHVVPIGQKVKFAYTQGDHLRVAHSLGHQEWDLQTLMLITGGEPSATISKSFRTWLPFTVAPISESMEYFGVVYALGQGVSVAVMPTEPTPSSAPLIFTIEAFQGAPLGEIVEKIREQTSVGAYEDFVVHVCGVDAQMGRLAASILTAMWSPSRLTELENSAGTRALVLLNSVYPLIPVGDWLRRQIGGLLEGTAKDKQLALQLLSRHPDLDPCAFPFDAVYINRETSVAENFISAVAAADIALFNDVMASAAHKADLIPAVLYCVSVVVSQKTVVLESNNLVAFVAIIVQCIGAGKQARDLLARLYWDYPRDVLFNRKKQKILVVVNKLPVFAVVFDLRKGTQVELASKESQLAAVEFVDDGNAVEASSAKQTYSWNLASGLFSIFKRQVHTVEPEAVAAALITKSL